mmetsp:Transcript_12872/g.36901  ORF Transcript_12872/g.36901 Transcript_12872/m.36901 type:complete len:192 (-) Transcript_12872:43-618(-)
MARSLRRVKKHRPKIIKRKKKTPFAKSEVPIEIKQDPKTVKEKLGSDWTEKWDKSKHNKDNYEASGFVYDPNQGRGRHKQTGIVVDEERVNDADDDKGQIDDDLRRALGRESLIHGKAAPKRPTKRQRGVIARLREAHGEDVRAMMLDHKRNTMQLSEAVLKEMMRACDYWPEGSGVDFRVPKKRLWTRGV